MAEQRPFASVELAASELATGVDEEGFADIALAMNPEPRCPCVLLVDVSGSMASVIDMINEGLRAYVDDIMQDYLALQRVEFAVITFGGDVETVVPFTTAQDFIPPTLVANGETLMGAAIIKAIELVRGRKRLYKQNGLHYFRPWIFLITDGKPTDAWQAAAAEVHKGEANKEFAFFAVCVAAAAVVNCDILQQISVRKPLPLKGYNFCGMYVWLSQSQRSVSHSQPGQENQIALNPPSGWANL